MRVYPISVNYQQNCKPKNFKKVSNSQVQFQGKHDCAKFFGGACGTLGTLGALGGIAIMTGGVSLIPTLAYGALCGGIGTAFGHMIDKDQPDYNKKGKK